VGDVLAMVGVTQWVTCWWCVWWLKVASTSSTDAGSSPAIYTDTQKQQMIQQQQQLAVQQQLLLRYSTAIHWPFK